MTVNAKCFQVSRMIGPVFTQFKNMMTMAIMVFYWLVAILANALIALENKLLEFYPVLNWRATIPRKFNAWYFRNDKERTHLFLGSILHHIEAAKLRAIITNANSFPGKCENILQKFWLNFIIANLNIERQFPSRFETWAHARNTGTIDDHGAHINIKSFVRIGIKFFWYFHSVKNAFGIDNNISDNEVFVRFSALARHLEIYRRFYKRSFDMAGRLINFAVVCGIEIISPFLGVINRPGGLLSTLRQGRKFGHWIAMLHQRGNTFDCCVNCIHANLLFENRPASLHFAGFCSGNGRLMQRSGSVLANKKHLDFLNGFIIS